jgi:hypothetical protein
MRRRGAAVVRATTTIGAIGAMGGWLANATIAANAQPIDPARPSTIVIGVPAGARTDRIDTGRTGLSQTPLPSSRLHVEWSTSIGAPLAHGPLVDARGWTYVVTSRGDAVAIARDGTERWRVPMGASDPGPAALLSDDTVVVADGTGNVVGMREGAVRWRSHVGIAGPSDPGPLPLDDGGVVVATAHDLALLDGEGHERARTVLSEPVATPLIWASGRVVMVAATGAVWTWVPGAAEPARVASFGSAPSGGAALAGDHTLVAVVAGQTSFASVDLLHGSRASAVGAIAPGGLWLGPPTLRGENAMLAVLGPTSEIAVAVDASGRELGRALLTGHLVSSRADAGTAVTTGLTAPLLVDLIGTVAFATFDGSVGVVSKGLASDGAVEVLGDACPRPGPLQGVLGGAPSPVAGLAPLPPASLVVACHSGALVAIVGGASAATSGSPRPSTL